VDKLFIGVDPLKIDPAEAVAEHAAVNRFVWTKRCRRAGSIGQISETRV
jgi:hypothetical protein